MDTSDLHIRYQAFFMIFLYAAFGKQLWQIKK